MADATPTRGLTLAIADTTLAAGLRYGLWVERAPSTEEQVAVSSMSQDKLGHAREFYQLADDLLEEDAVELQYERDADAFGWNPAWLAPWPTWAHFVVAQTVLGRALLEELRSLDEDSVLRGPLTKIEQEDTWHARHGSAWLEQAAHDQDAQGSLQEAVDDLWPAAVGVFGVEGQERFPRDLEDGALARSDEEAREAFLDEVVPQLDEAGLEVEADSSADGWTTEPSASKTLIDDLRSQGREMAIELTGMLQDPMARELAEL